MKKRNAFPVLFVLLVLLISACSAPAAGNASIPTEESPTDAAVIDSPPTNTAAAEPSPLPSEPPIPFETQPPSSGWVAYIGADDNVYLVERFSMETRQLTEDAVLLQPDTETEPIRYCCLQWSSDGNLLSFLREESIKVENAYNYNYTFIVHDVLSNTRRTIVPDQNMLGYDWQPDTHQIAFGLPVEQDYWISRDTVRAELAHGIQILDADTGEFFSLVEPVGGYTLGLPRWSPDGRFLSFDEIQFMEGRGRIAYYDFANSEYISRGEQVFGTYDWSPDGEWLVYDKIDYRPQGGERIWISARTGGEERALSPEYNPPGYAFAPAFSPTGERVAYLVNFDGIDSTTFNLFVIDVEGGEPVDYGTYEQVWQLHWTSDGNSLVFSEGPFEQKRVIEVNLVESQIEQLAQGSEAVPQPYAEPES